MTDKEREALKLANDTKLRAELLRVEVGRLGKTP